jgi:hypothetical protein
MLVIAAELDHKPALIIRIELVALVSCTPSALSDLLLDEV